MKNQQPAVLKNETAATYLGVSPAQLRLSRCTGELFKGVQGPQYLRLGSRSIRYLKKDLDTWVAQHQRYNNTSEVTCGGVQ